MDADIEKRIHDLVIAAGCAIDDLPILARLEFAKNIVTQNGEDKNHAEREPALVLAVDVLNGVIDVLKTSPAAKLRVPKGEPEPT
jgi:hypothetical protein